MTRCAITALAALALGQGAVAGPPVIINEIRIDHLGTDTEEYFELAGTAKTSLDGMTYVVLGDSALGCGVIEEAVDLTGESIRASGFFVAAETTFTLGPVNLFVVDGINFENGDDVTHMLVTGFTGSIGDDLDDGDDGILDFMPWTAVLDAVSLVGPGDCPAYATETIGPDGIFVPGHVYRCTPDGTWTIGEFDLDDPGATDTAGAANTSCDFIPPCGADFSGSCFEANGTPFCDDADCCQDIIDNFNPACATVWDQTCADLALLNCLSCGDEDAGDCFAANGTPYCNLAGCCDTVCAMDPSCCDDPATGWDQACADAAVTNCPISTVQKGNVALGLSQFDAEASMELAGGPPVLNGGVQIPDSWQQSFIGSVEFDNLDGISHNAAGNLIGVNFGAVGGSIYSLPTCLVLGAGELIGDTVGLGGSGLTETRLGGASVSPDNAKIAVSGYDTGHVIVYDYVAGDCLGAGASLSGARETPIPPLCLQDTQGTAWLDNSTVIAYASTGNILTLDCNDMSFAVVATVADICGPGFTDVEYNPEISSFVYAMGSAFDGATTNTLSILDPDNAWSLVATLDYSMSMNTSREIALDNSGNLYVTMFSGNIDIILDVENATDNDSLDWYAAATFDDFPGLDVALSGSSPCPWDCEMAPNGQVGTTDLLALLAQWGNPGSCDFDGGGDVGTTDLLKLLAEWGDCP